MEEVIIVISPEPGGFNRKSFPALPGIKELEKNKKNNPICGYLRAIVSYVFDNHGVPKLITNNYGNLQYIQK